MMTITISSNKSFEGWRNCRGYDNHQVIILQSSYYDKGVDDGTSIGDFNEHDADN